MKHEKVHRSYLAAASDESPDEGCPESKAECMEGSVRREALPGCRLAVI